MPLVDACGILSLFIEIFESVYVLWRFARSNPDQPEDDKLCMILCMQTSTNNNGVFEWDIWI